MAEALVRLGHRVDVFFAATRDDENEQVNGVNYFCLPLDWRARAARVRRLRNEFVWGAEFLRRAGACSYDLYYAHNLFAVPWIVLAAARAKRPWVYQAHEYLTPKDCSGIGRIYAELERLLSRHASIVICPEPHRAELMARDQRLSAVPLVVRNAATVVPIVDDSELRNGCGATGRIVLYQGGFDASPQMVALVRSTAHWNAGDRLVVIGWGADTARQVLEKVAAESNALEKLRFYGSVRHDRLWPLLCGADIGLVLYTSATPNERFAAPNKLGEYLMAGLPVVYTRCEGLSSFLHGLPFAREVGDSLEQDFAAALSSLQGDELLAAKTAARAYAEREYCFEVQSRRALDALTTVMRKNP